MILTKYLFIESTEFDDVGEELVLETDDDAIDEYQAVVDEMEYPHKELNTPVDRQITKEEDMAFHRFLDYYQP